MANGMRSETHGCSSGREAASVDTLSANRRHLTALAIAILQTWLQSRSADALSPGLRAAIAEAAQLPGADAGMPDAWPVLVDKHQALAGLSAEGEVIAAALLFGVTGLQPALKTQLEKQPGIAGLLDGQQAAAQVWALHAERAAAATAKGCAACCWRSCATCGWCRSCWRGNWRACAPPAQLPAAERRALAQLTGDIHAPLANRLGIWQLKWELEDLAFRYLQPETYQRIARAARRKARRPRALHRRGQAQLRAALAAQGIARRGGRPARSTSTASGGRCSARACDQRALRHARGARAGRRRRRLLRRARRGARAVGADAGRVRRLHRPAQGQRLPVPAYRGDRAGRDAPSRCRSAPTRCTSTPNWASPRTGATRKAAQARGGLRPQDRLDAPAAGSAPRAEATSEAAAGEFDAELVEDRIYVLTPKGEVVDLPQGGTVLDFAYHVHTEVGHRCRGAKVNGRIVPLDYKPVSGDRVEIMTAQDRRAAARLAAGGERLPRQRPRARQGPRLVPQARPRAQRAGRQGNAGARNCAAWACIRPTWRRCSSDSTSTASTNCTAVALGDVGPSQVGRALHEHAQRAGAQPAPARRALRRPPRARAGAAQSQLHRGGRRQPALAAGALLPAGAGRPDRRLPDPRPRRQRAPRNCARRSAWSPRSPQRVLPVSGARPAAATRSTCSARLDRKWLLKDITNAHRAGRTSTCSASSSDDVRRGLVRNPPAPARERLRAAGQLLGKLDAVPGVQEARRSG